MTIYHVPSITELNLNDSELVDVIIKGSNITMRLLYIEEYETMQMSDWLLIFHDCIEAKLLLHLAYDSPNSILEGVEEPEGEYRRIRIETNSTASIFEIVAKFVTLEPVVHSE